MAGAYAVAGRCVRDWRDWRDWRDGCASAYRQFVLERLGQASERPRRAGACLRHQSPCHSRPHVPSSPPVSEALAKPSAVVASALVQSLRPVRPSGSDGQGPSSQAQSRRSLAPARQHSVFHVKQSTAQLKGMRCMAIRLIAAKPPASARLQASHERLSPTAAASIATQPSACCRPLPVPRRHPRYTRYPSLGGESRSASTRWGTG
jgi:hypothetical protein